MLAKSVLNEAYTPAQLVVGGNVQTVKGVIAAGAAVVMGAVLGQITASKKFVLCNPGAADGSQTPVAIAACDVDNAAAADTEAPIYVSGQFALQGLTFHGGFATEAAKLAAFKVDAPIIIKKLGYSGN